MAPTKEDLDKHLGQYYQGATSNASKSCRVIVFAVIGVIWVLFQQGGTFPFPILPTKALALLFLYVLIDILQYFVTAIWYGILYYRTQELSPTDKERRINTADKWIFAIFIIKISYLVFIMMVIIWYAFFRNIEQLQMLPI